MINKTRSFMLLVPAMMMWTAASFIRPEITDVSSGIRPLIVFGAMVIAWISGFFYPGGQAEE